MFSGVTANIERRILQVGGAPVILDDFVKNIKTTASDLAGQLKGQSAMIWTEEKLFRARSVLAETLPLLEASKFRLESTFVNDGGSDFNILNNLLKLQSSLFDGLSKLSTALQSAAPNSQNGPVVSQAITMLDSVISTATSIENEIGKFGSTARMASNQVPEKKRFLKGAGDLLLKIAKGADRNPLAFLDKAQSVQQASIAYEKAFKNFPSRLQTQLAELTPAASSIQIAFPINGFSKAYAQEVKYLNDLVKQIKKRGKPTPRLLTAYLQLANATAFAAQKGANNARNEIISALVEVMPSNLFNYNMLTPRVFAGLADATAANIGRNNPIAPLVGASSKLIGLMGDNKSWNELYNVWEASKGELDTTGSTFMGKLFKFSRETKNLGGMPREAAAIFQQAAGMLNVLKSQSDKLPAKQALQLISTILNDNKALEAFLFTNGERRDAHPIALLGSIARLADKGTPASVIQNVADVLFGAVDMKGRSGLPREALADLGTLLNVAVNGDLNFGDKKVQKALASLLNIVDSGLCQGAGGCPADGAGIIGQISWLLGNYTNGINGFSAEALDRMSSLIFDTAKGQLVQGASSKYAKIMGTTGRILQSIGDVLELPELTELGTTLLDIAESKNIGVMAIFTALDIINVIADPGDGPESLKNALTKASDDLETVGVVVTTVAKIIRTLKGGNAASFLISKIMSTLGREVMLTVSGFLGNIAGKIGLSPGSPAAGSIGTAKDTLTTLKDIFA